MQLNKGHTYLELLAVMLIMGIMAAVYIGLARQRSFRTLQQAEEVYQDMRKITEYYTRRRTCSAAIPAGCAATNPVNSQPYTVVCLRQGVAVSTSLPADFLIEFNHHNGISISGNTVTFIQYWRMTGDGGFERKHYYNQ